MSLACKNPACVVLRAAVLVLVPWGGCQTVRAAEPEETAVVHTAAAPPLYPLRIEGSFHDTGWLQVAADQSPVLTVGTSLTPQVRVKRAGRLLSLDYDLLDADGRKYGGRRAEGTGPPTFTVYKDGQIIGSGSFEYG
jgi:hypothetical protein